jgi:hypothetical protein
MQMMNARPSRIGRRAVLVAAAAIVTRGAAAAAKLPVPSTDALGFRMMRHGDEIGTHKVTFERSGDVLTVRISVDAVVTFAAIPIVHYRHRAVEIWQGAALFGVTGETNKNGARGWVDARRTDAGLVVTGSQTKRYVAPAEAIPTSYWNKQMLSGPMISLEDGVLLSPKIADLRTDSIRLASGRTIAANHYALSGAFAVDLWYDTAETWAGMAMTVVDGSEVRYERL